jgi:hypothetical protein
MSNLIAHAKAELARLRSPGGEPDEMQDAIEENVLKIVEAFSEGGHSGSSAAYTLSIVKKVLAFEPVTPLNGEDDEWFVHDRDDECYAQNKRCGHVFKRRNGVAYDINAVVFRDPDGSTCTGRDSRRDITFPYTPKTEIVDRTPEEAA